MERLKVVHDEEKEKERGVGVVTEVEEPPSVSIGAISCCSAHRRSRQRRRRRRRRRRRLSQTSTQTQNATWLQNFSFARNLQILPHRWWHRCFKTFACTRLAHFMDEIYISRGEWPRLLQRRDRVCWQYLVMYLSCYGKIYWPDCRWKMAHSLPLYR